MREGIATELCCWLLNLPHSNWTAQDERGSGVQRERSGRGIRNKQLQCEWGGYTVKKSLHQGKWSTKLEEWRRDQKQTTPMWMGRVHCKKVSSSREVEYKGGVEEGSETNNSTVNGEGAHCKKFSLTNKRSWECVGDWSTVGSRVD